MADDLVELGLEGADKLIDKHFHKIPDKALHKDTYKHPFRKDSQDTNNDNRGQDSRSRQGDRRDREKRRDSVWEQQEAAAEEGRYNSSRRDQDLNSRRSRQQFDTEWDHHRDSQRTRSPSPRTNMAQPQYRDNNGRPLNNANSTIYAQDGPFVTPPWETLPDYRAPAAGVNPNVSQQFSPRDPNGRVYEPTTYTRPAPSRRRSSSYHGPRETRRFSSPSSDSDDEDSDYHRRRSGNGRSHASHSQNQLARQNNKTESSFARSDRGSKNSSHQDRDFKENIKDNFTDSTPGIAGSALGALIGGYVTHKALESRGHRETNKDKALTLLGAVVSGVAVNAVVDKFEDRKEAQTERRRQGKEIRDERERHGGRRDGRDRFDDGRRARSERGNERRERDYYR